MPDEALELALSESPEPQGEVLAALAPVLPATSLRRAVDIAAGLTDDGPRLTALAALLTRLPPDEALERAQLEPEGHAPGRLRAAVLAILPEPARTATVREALAVWESASDPLEAIRTALLIAPHLAESERERLLGRALELGPAAPRPEAALSLLAPHLPGVVHAEIAAQPARWPAVVAALAPHLPAPHGRELAEALVAERPEVLADAAGRELAPLLTSTTVAAQLGAARLGAYDAVLTALAPHLPAAAIPGALAAVDELSTQEERARALAALAPRLDARGCQRALAIAMSIGDAPWRVLTAAALAPWLDDAGQARVAVAARDALPRVSAARCPPLIPVLLHGFLHSARPHSALLLGAAALGFSPPTRDGLLDDAVRVALDSAPAVPDASERSGGLAPPDLTEAVGGVAETLGCLFPYLPEAARQRCWSWLSDLRDLGTWWRFHTSLPGMPRSEEYELLLESEGQMLWWDRRARLGLPASMPAIARAGMASLVEWTTAGGRDRVLLACGPHLPEDLLEEVIAAGERLVGESPREVSAALVRLAPRLSGDLASRAVAVAERIPKDDRFSPTYPRSAALCALAPRLDPADARATIETITLDYYRALARLRLAAALPASSDARTDALTDGVRAVANMPAPLYRARLLLDAANTLPELRGPALVTAVREAEAEAAAAAEADSRRTRVGILLGPDRLTRVSVLLGLAPLLEPPAATAAITRALRLALAIREVNEEWRSFGVLLVADATEGLAPAAAFEILESVMEDLSTTIREHLLTHLRYLAPLLGALGGTGAAGATLDAIDSVARWWP